MRDRVEFTDVRVRAETTERVREVLESGRFVKGPRLADFEERFAERTGVEHAVGVSNGTAAIYLALAAAGVGKGDEVFVPGHTFFATVSPVLALGADPVFVDVEDDTFTIDPDALADAIRESENAAAVIPVHVHGLMADMSAIQDVAAPRDLFVLEDACQAHFARRDGETAGSSGDAGAFSFYPSKNMTVAGDGGMVTTDDGTLAERIRRLRNHGRDEHGVHRTLGLNYRLDETNAAVGLGQLERVEDWNQHRNAAAGQYTERLGEGLPLRPQGVPPETDHVYHHYAIRAPDRDGLRAHLRDMGIETGIHYPHGAHQHPAIGELLDPPELSRTERLVEQLLSLPMHPRLDDGEIERVCAAIEGYYR